jgi:hypothetical protein
VRTERFAVRFAGGERRELVGGRRGEGKLVSERRAR